MSNHIRTSDSSRTSLPEYEVYALRFGSLSAPAQNSFLIPSDQHDGPLQLDFFVWAVRNSDRTVIFDMGFGTDSAVRRNRDIAIHPIDALASIGIDAAAVPDVVISHLHYDHSGNSEFFTSAKFHIQDKEMEFATGRFMCHCVLRRAFDVENVTSMVEHVYKDRVVFHNGDDQIAPGISLHWIGGHTAGIQVLRVHTQRGWIVLASDAAHYYRNFLKNDPFPIVLNIGEVIEGNRKLIALADSEEHVIPGHDPLVLQIYPHHPASPNIACLHIQPTSRLET